MSITSTAVLLHPRFTCRPGAATAKQGLTFAPSETRPVGALPLPALPCPVTPRPAALVTVLCRSLSLLDMMQGRRRPGHRAAMEVHIRLTAPCTLRILHSGPWQSQATFYMIVDML